MIDIVFIWLKDIISVILISLATLPLTVVYDMFLWVTQTGEKIFNCFTTFHNPQAEETEEEETVYPEPVEVKGFHQEGRDE